MNYVPLDDLNNAKKKILFLLSTKYKDPNSEYIETDDTDTDSSFLAIVGGIEKSRNLILQLLTLVTRTDDIPGTPGVIGRPGVPERYAEGAAILNKDGKTQKRNNKGVPQYETEVIPAVPAVLAVAEVATVPGKSHFRTMNTYINFNQLSLNLESNLKNINVAFSKVINSIGYVEPDNMQTYKENFNDFQIASLRLIDVVVKDNTFYTRLYSPIKKDDENVNLDLANVYNRIGQELEKLVTYNNEIQSTYNYKNGNMNNKRSPQEMPSSQPSKLNEDDE